LLSTGCSPLLAFFSGQKAQLQFDLSPEVAKEMAVKGNTGDSSGTSALEGPSGTIEIPREHKVHLQSFGNQSMYVFSEDSEGKLAAEGKVVQKAEMQPQQNKMYLQLKKKQMVDAQEPKYQIQQIKETTVSTFKPKSYHQPDQEHLQKRKELGRRARQDREVVLDQLFTAFQAHQYYTFKDLVQKTEQPPTYLKEILREVCKYNTKNPHKNMYELKPEYRHYKKAESDMDQ
jgi:transcription initiation factor TFIIF subunit beta